MIAVLNSEAEPFETWAVNMYMYVPMGQDDNKL